MSEFSSQKTILVFWIFIFLIGFNQNADAVLRFKRNFKVTATVDYIIDDQHILALSNAGDWNVGEILPIISQNAKLGVFAYTELVSVRMQRPGRYELKLKLLRQSRRYIIQQGDYVKRLNLDSENPDYIGTTDLLVKDNEVTISSKYKPLVTQGIFIGETAQTLYDEEIMLNFIGNVSYGITDSLMVGSFLPVNVLVGANGAIKYKVYDSESATVSAGLSYVELRKDSESSLNFNFYWDSVSTDSLISHVYASVGLVKWKKASEAAAIKGLGSSFQTGYEVIMSNWDRFLIGPSYNFESRTLGGYLSYVWIYDRFHAQASINTTDITSLKVDDLDGYYGAIDFYWRF